MHKNFEMSHRQTEDMKKICFWSKNKVVSIVCLTHFSRAVLDVDYEFQIIKIQNLCLRKLYGKERKIKGKLGISQYFSIFDEVELTEKSQFFAIISLHYRINIYKKKILVNSDLNFSNITLKFTFEHNRCF